MNETRFERLGALGGVVFVVLVVVGALIGGTPPKVTDSAQEITSYFRDNQDALKIAGYLGGVAIVPFFWFLGTLYGRLRRAEGGNGRVSGIALTGGVATAAVALIGYGVTGYGALYPDAGVESFRISTIIFGYLGFAAAVFTAATSVVIMRTALLPAAVAWLGAIDALLWIAGGATVSSVRDVFAALAFIAFLVWALWLLLISVMLYRREPVETERG